MIHVVVAKRAMPPVIQKFISIENEEDCKPKFRTDRLSCLNKEQRKNCIGTDNNPDSHAYICSFYKFI